MSAMNLKKNIEELIHSIERVFADVRLEDGVSMTQARAIDDYRSDDEQTKARQKDTEE